MTGEQWRRRTINGFVAGVEAGILASLLMLVFKRMWEVATLPDIVADGIVQLVPSRVFAFLLLNLREDAKPLLFISLIVAQVVLGGLIGWAYARTQGARIAAPLRSSWATGLAIAALLWLFTVLVLLPLSGAGLLGSELWQNSRGTLLSFIFLYALFGSALARFYHSDPIAGMWRWYNTRQIISPQRRRFLVVSGAGLVVLVTGGFALSRFRQRAGAQSRAMLTPEVTPTANFYVVSKNLTDPEVDLTGWRLHVDGLVENPFTLPYDELLALPSVSQYVTLECISNSVGGNLMGNALWTGVPLKDLLARAKPQAGAADVVFHAWDKYSDSIPLIDALDDATLVAYAMNGERLNSTHGFPVRLIVPGLYGEKHVKWLTRIEVVDYDYKGYWQGKGWSDTAVINTTSRIDVPRGRIETSPSMEIEPSFDPSLPPILPPPNDRVPVEPPVQVSVTDVMVGGIAFAGRQGIRRVEVSTDGGDSWQQALVKPPLSPYAWVLWVLRWPVRATGAYRLRVRAVDGTGEVQTDVPRDPFPEGATGIHEVSVEVREKLPPGG